MCTTHERQKKEGSEKGGWKAKPWQLAQISAAVAGTDKCCCGWSFNPVLSSSKQKEQALVHQQHGAARALKLKLFQSVTFGHRA